MPEKPRTFKTGVIRLSELGPGIILSAEHHLFETEESIAEFRKEFLNNHECPYCGMSKPRVFYVARVGNGLKVTLKKQPKNINLLWSGPALSYDQALRQYKETLNLEKEDKK